MDHVVIQSMLLILAREEVLREVEVVDDEEVEYCVQTVVQISMMMVFLIT